MRIHPDPDYPINILQKDFVNLHYSPNGTDPNSFQWQSVYTTQIIYLFIEKVTFVFIGVVNIHLEKG